SGGAAQVGRVHLDATVGQLAGRHQSRGGAEQTVQLAVAGAEPATAGVEGDGPGTAGRRLTGADLAGQAAGRPAAQGADVGDVDVAAEGQAAAQIARPLTPDAHGGAGQVDGLQQELAVGLAGQLETGARGLAQQAADHAGAFAARPGQVGVCRRPSVAPADVQRARKPGDVVAGQGRALQADVPVQRPVVGIPAPDALPGGGACEGDARQAGEGGSLEADVDAVGGAAAFDMDHATSAGGQVLGPQGPAQTVEPWPVGVGQGGQAEAGGRADPAGVAGQQLGAGEVGEAGHPGAALVEPAVDVQRRDLAGANAGQQMGLVDRRDQVERLVGRIAQGAGERAAFGLMRPQVQPQLVQPAAIAEAGAQVVAGPGQAEGAELGGLQHAVRAGHI